MNQSDKNTFLGLIDKLAETIGVVIQPIRKALYFETLFEYSIDDLEAAFKAVRKEWKFSFFPQPAEIIKLIGDKPDDVADQQCSILINSVSKIGSYQSVRFEDTTTNAVVQSLGGWVSVCQRMTTDDLNWFRKEFKELYLSCKQTGMSSNVALKGRHNNTVILIAVGGEIKECDKNQQVEYVGDLKKIPCVLKELV